MGHSTDLLAPRFFAGRMLLAMPGIGSPSFEHAAIALCVHDEHGALGIDIGKVIDGLSLRDLLANLDIDGSGLEHVPVLRGGPVDPQRGFVLHSLDWGGQDLLQVNEAWGLSGSLDILRAIAAGRGPTHYLVSLGYAGWDAGQLETEMRQPGWFLGETFGHDIIAMPCASRWESLFAASGVDVRLLTGTSGMA
jgi:putative transcriptional regulator